MFDQIVSHLSGKGATVARMATKRMGHIRQRGNRWQAIAGFRDKTGKNIQLSSSHATKTEANKALLDLVKRAQDGQRPTMPGTLADLMTAWWGIKSPQLSPTTRNTWETVMGKHIINGPIGGIKVKQLDGADIERFYNGLRRHPDLGPAGVNKVHTILTAALRQAVRLEWLERNPLDKVKAPPKPRVDQPAARDEVTVGRMIEVAGEKAPWFGLFTQLAVESGARRGELCAMRWERIIDGIMLISESTELGGNGTGVRIKGTKSQRSRSVPLGPKVLERLEAYRLACLEIAVKCGVKELGPFIFSSDAAHRAPMNPTMPTRMWGTVRTQCVAEGLKVDDMSLHDLRHTFASWLLRDGVPLSTVSHLLGHADQAITIRVYNQRDPIDDKRVIKFFADKWTDSEDPEHP